MAGMFDMVKKAASMQKQMKKVQKDLARKTADGTSGSVTVVARGDMSIKSVSIAESDLGAQSAEKLEKMVLAATNAALESVKKMAGSEMSKMTGGLGGLADLMG